MLATVGNGPCTRIPNTNGMHFQHFRNLTLEAKQAFRKISPTSLVVEPHLNETTKSSILDF